MSTFKPFVPEPGYCRCRHRVKLHPDGTNPCQCCAGQWPDEWDGDDDDGEDGPGIEPQAERALVSSAEAYRLVQEARDMRDRAETFETAFDEVTEMLGAVRAERDAALAQLARMTEAGQELENALLACRFPAGATAAEVDEWARAASNAWQAVIAEREA